MASSIFGSRQLASAFGCSFAFLVNPVTAWQSTETGSIVAHVPLGTIPRASSNRVLLLLVAPHGEREGKLHTVHVDAKDSIRVDALKPGHYDLALAIPDERYHTFFTYAEARVESGKETTVSFATPSGDAILEVVPEQTPPWSLMLLSPEARVPSDLRELQRNLGQSSLRRDRTFQAHGDGRGPKRFTRLPAGEYLALLCANDWQPGDPPIVPRGIRVRLPAGQITLLRLEDGLARMSVVEGPRTLEQMQQVTPRLFADVPHASTSTLTEWIESSKQPVHLLDVRAEAEFRVSQLAGAQRVDPGSSAKDLIEGVLADTSKSARIVCYCSVGMRSAVLARRLRKAGFTDVHNLSGSIFAWAMEGRPLYRGDEPVATVHPFDEQWGLMLRPELRFVGPR